MKYIFYPFLAIAITITSCKNSDEEKSKPDPRTVIPFTQQGTTALQSQATQQPAPQNHNLFRENNTVTTPSVVAGVNPAHGQPNHRCDIAVGAPLNTAAKGTAVASQPNVVQMQQPQVKTITQSTSKTVTPKGMNPPHGQPNHRCDIPVGASLNSKPTAKTAVTTPVTPVSGEVTQNVTVKPPVPFLAPQNSENTQTAEGMNPAHGQAGHRCDIAVGAPLPKS